MQTHDAEPLPTGLWLREMMVLADDCAGMPLMAPDHAVRRAHYLCCLCPIPLRTLLLPKFSESDLESLLVEGKIEAAAALVIGQSGEILVVQLDDMSGYQARFGTGDDIQTALDARLPVLAMIGAWARFFSEPRRP